MNFEKRSSDFQDELENLQKKHKVQLYPAQVVLQNGEIALLIKLRDAQPEKL